MSEAANMLDGDPRRDGARCWIYGASKKISSGDPAFAGRLSRFMGEWNAHGSPVAGYWRVIHDRFLIVVQGPEGAEASGCSIDTMKAQIRLLEDDLQTPLLDSSRVFFRNAADEIEAATRPEFKRLARAGAVGPDTEVFDTTVLKLGDLRPGVFSKPLRDSWHLRLYENALAQDAVK